MKLTGETRADARRAGVGAEMRLMREEGRTIDREAEPVSSWVKGPWLAAATVVPSTFIPFGLMKVGEVYTIHLDVQLTAVVLLEFASSLSLICIALDFAALLSNSQA
ncbi:unnamed protein product [Sphagnum compactum]